MLVGVMSKRINKIPHLEKLLEAPYQLLQKNKHADYTHIAGWGLKPTSKRARVFAQKNKLTYISLEDGFIRSLDLGVNKATQHSMTVDFQGIYYDARSPSDLEQLIIDIELDREQVKRAERCISLIREHRLSKYNAAPDINFESTNKPKVLVIDQTFGDASIDYGLATSESFELMLRTAVAENPEHEVLVKIHPDVLTGKKQGHLLEIAQELNCTLVAEPMSPWSLLDVIDKAYVVTSQLGFEALMAGKEVHCFGMPFYAGWGLTIDRQQVVRRNKRRTLAEVFYSAYLIYTRYLNPYTGERCQLEDTIAIISEQKRLMERFRGQWLLAGGEAELGRRLGGFLSIAAQVSILDEHCDDEYLIEGHVQSHVCMPAKIFYGEQYRAQQDYRKRMLASEEQGKPLYLISEGFLSYAPDANKEVPQLSMVIDSRGMYYDSNRSSDLEQILSTHSLSSELLAKAHRVRERFVQLKNALYQDIHLCLPDDREIILIPGQSRNDLSVVKGSVCLASSQELLKQVRQDNPEAYIIFVPEKDAGDDDKVSEFKGSHSDYDLLIEDHSPTALLAYVDAVHTLTDPVGFEALLRGIQVYTYGMPYYAGWGLTQDKVSCERRKHRLSLDALVAGVLIQYPLYVDAFSGDHIDVEIALEHMDKIPQSKPLPNTKTRIRRFLRQLFSKSS